MVKELPYDSFYKFIFSLGIASIISPLVAAFYLLCIGIGNQFLLDQNTYKSLSITSKFFVQQRHQIITLILQVFPYVMLFLIILGILCLIYGGSKWHMTQKRIDEQFLLQIIEKKLHLKKMTTSEIITKNIQENNESKTFSWKTSSFRNRFLAMLNIEQQCFNLLLQKYSKQFFLYQNVKIHNTECDIVAISKKGSIDYLFEIKYWPLTPSFNPNHILHKLEQMRVNYETSSKRDCHTILIIITNANSKERIQQLFKNKGFPFLHIDILTEQELKQESILKNILL